MNLQQQNISYLPCHLFKESAHRKQFLNSQKSCQLQNYSLFTMLGRVFRSFSEKQPKPSQYVRPVKPAQPVKTSPQNQLLPDLISSRILDLEMQCQKQTINKQTVFQLIAEYTKAVEFYEEKGNDKYKLYQKRMHNFLSLPIIEEILKGKSGQMVMRKQKKEEKIRKVEDKAQQQAKQMIKKEEQREKKHQKIIQSEIQKQEGALQERRRHRRAISNRSITNSSFQTDLEEKNVNNEESAKKAKAAELESLDMKVFLASLGEKKRREKKVEV